ncbi:MAG: CorA family divalent cation transporter [Planctomycetota bacterium]
MPTPSDSKTDSDVKSSQSHRVPGKAPGQFERSSFKASSIRVIAYREDKVEVIESALLATAKRLESDFDVVWIDVIGVEDSNLLKEFGELFQIHPLSLEDIGSTNQRAKIETFDTYTYCVSRMINREPELNSEQLSIFHCGKIVVTFQEREGDCLDPIRKRIGSALGFIRKRSSDYLVYALIDSVVDHYFPILDDIGERIDQLDTYLVEDEQKFSAADYMGFVATFWRSANGFVPIGR